MEMTRLCLPLMGLPLTGLPLMVLSSLVMTGATAQAAEPEPPSNTFSGGATSDQEAPKGPNSEPVPTWESDEPPAADSETLAPVSDRPAPGDPVCRALPPCLYEGRCSARAGGCVSSSDAECKASLWCRDYGLCSVGRDGACGAETDADCAQAGVCHHKGFCDARNRTCGSMRHIAIAEDDEESEGRYTPREGRNTERNVPLLVSGIVLTIAGGAGAVWLISEVVSAGLSGWSGGGGGDESSARLAGSICMTIGGLGLGLPFIIVGGRSRPVGRASQYLPVLTIAPGSASLHLSF